MTRSIYPNRTTTIRFLAAALPLILAACSQHPSSDASAAPSTPSDTSSVPVAPSTSTSASASTDERDETAEESANTPASSKPATSSDAASLGPHIKGFALGASPDATQAALTALIPPGSPCHIDQKTDTTNPFLNLTISTTYGIALNCGTVPTQPDYTAFFEFQNQRLSKYTIGTDLSALAFNSGQMPLKDFAQGFVDAYGLPGLEPSGNQQYLTYRDADHGWELDLYPDKSFKVYVVETTAQQAKSFN